jgi:diamine N-acetyltransferase
VPLRLGAYYHRNMRAVAFPERCGFAKVGGRKFVPGSRVCIDPIPAAALRPATEVP